MIGKQLKKTTKYFWQIWVGPEPKKAYSRLGLFRKQILFFLSKLVFRIYIFIQIFSLFERINLLETRQIVYF